MFENSNVEAITHCLACGSSDLKLTLDLGSQPLANSYKLNKDEAQPIFPLAINHCKKCFHVQLTHAVNPDLMFKDYLYVTGTSKTMNDHCKWFAGYAYEYFFNMTQRRPVDVLDIGCNDGTQLNFFKDKEMQTYGVDPAENLLELSSKNHVVWAEYFDDEFVKKLEITSDFDLIVAQNVFAHNYDPLGFLKSASKVMSNHSLMFIQTSQADMILNNEFDTIYHEHISFYNTNSMNELCKRAGLFLVDMVRCPLHGNSYIFVVSKIDRRPENVKNLVAMDGDLYNEEVYEQYENNCQWILHDLQLIESQLREGGYKLIGYGAAAKGMTLINWTKLRLDCIIDDNPLKQGRYTPGISIPIVSSDILSTYKPEDKIAFIPLAWNFFDEISKRIKSVRDNENDLFVTYFPSVEVGK